MHDDHMRTLGKAFICMTVIIVPFVSCSRTHHIRIVADPQCEGFVHSLLEEHPLPGGYRVIEGTAEGRAPEADISIHFSSKIEDQNGTKILSRTPLVPVVPLLDQRESVSEGEARLLPLKPLDAVNLPERGLPVNGLYPEDPAYPLFECITARIEGETIPQTLEEWFENIPEAESLKKGVTIGAVGDILAGRGVEKILLQGEKGLSSVFSDTLPVLRSHDLLIGNLEGPVSRGGEKRVKTYTFRFPPQILQALASSGFTYLMAANNHSFDYGEEAFLDTLKHLTESAIATSGVGDTIEEALTPWYTEIRGVPIAVLSIGAFPAERSGFNGRLQVQATDTKPGILWFGEKALASVKAMKERGAFSVVCVHGGVEYSNSPSTSQIEMYRKIIDAGADIVFGSHPHVLQGMEVYGKGLIVYSLGNFVFPGMEEMNFATETAIITLRVYDGAIRYVEITPARISGTRTSIDRTGMVKKRLISLSQALQKGK